MDGGGNITLKSDLYQQVEEAARADGTTADELATQAVKRELVRRFWEKNHHAAALRRGNLTDAQVEDTINRAISESCAIRGH